jgi:uncharacterized protein YbjT (DUF2867 family)
MIDDIKAKKDLSKLYVLVTGVTGNQGGAVASELRKRGHKVRGMTRNPKSDKALALKNESIDVIKGNYDDPATIELALEGINTVFLMGTPFKQGVEAETKQGITFVDIAKKLNIKHLIYTSVGSAHKNTGIPHFESKFKVEEHIRNIKVPYTIIRPVYFMENFLAPFSLPDLKKGRRSAPMPPDRKLAMISVRDIGRFVAYIIERREEFLGKAIDIASDNISGKESAVIFSQTLGFNIDYYEQDYEDIATFGEDMVLMYKWFNEVGYNIDIDELYRNYPEVGWLRFEDWVKEQDWAVLDQPIKQAIL